MSGLLGQLIRPNARSRRLMAGISAALLLGVIVFSSVFVAVESDHDCSGHDCPICLGVQECIGNLQLMGSSVPSADVIPQAVTVRPVETPSDAYRAPATTLQSLDVRFDE